jgi:hypothetical protein
MLLCGRFRCGLPEFRGIALEVLDRGGGNPKRYTAQPAAGLAVRIGLEGTLLCGARHIGDYTTDFRNFEIKSGGWDAGVLLSDNVEKVCSVV